MERFSDDIFGLILENVTDREDRSSFSMVCKQWARVEGIARTSLRVLEPDFARKFLRRFPNLTTLEVNTRISDENLESIAEMCPRLRIINLSLRRAEWGKGFQAKDFGRHGLQAIAVKCRCLMKVSLKRRDLVRDDGVVALVRNAKNLKILDLSWCSKISDLSLVAMEKRSSLANLYLKGCSLITNDGLVSLAIGTPAQTLRVLDLTDCDRITDHALHSMPRMSCLHELHLADCGPKITDEGGVAVSWISSLRVLDLSWLINLSNETLFAVAENCKNLVEITLTGCELITGFGVCAFATHESLEMIRLSRCYSISIDDVEEIVVRCNSLKHLVLDNILKKLMSPSANEKLSRLYVDWI